MIANNKTIAYICNDLENHEDYVLGENGECFYKGELVGKIDEESSIVDGTLHIYFHPIKAVQNLNINITITPTGVKFNS